MIESSLSAIALATARPPQSPRHIGAHLPVAPGTRPAGLYPVAAGMCPNNRPAAAFFIRVGRSGRSGLTAAYLADRASSLPHCLRVAPGEGAGSL